MIVRIFSKRQQNCFVLLYTCLPGYGNIGLQRTKNVGTLFAMKGSKNFFVINLRRLGKIEFGIENALLLGVKEKV